MHRLGLSFVVAVIALSSFAAPASALAAQAAPPPGAAPARPAPPDVSGTMPPSQWPRAIPTDLPILTSALLGKSLPSSLGFHLSRGLELAPGSDLVASYRAGDKAILLANDQLESLVQTGTVAAELRDRVTMLLLAHAYARAVEDDTLGIDKYLRAGATPDAVAARQALLDGLAILAMDLVAKEQAKHADGWSPALATARKIQSAVDANSNVPRAARARGACEILRETMQKSGTGAMWKLFDAPPANCVSFEMAEVNAPLTPELPERVVKAPPTVAPPVATGDLATRAAASLVKYHDKFGPGWQGVATPAAPETQFQQHLKSMDAAKQLALVQSCDALVSWKGTGPHRENLSAFTLHAKDAASVATWWKEIQAMAEQPALMMANKEATRSEATDGDFTMKTLRMTLSVGANPLKLVTAVGHRGAWSGMISGNFEVPDETLKMLLVNALDACAGAEKAGGAPAAAPPARPAPQRPATGR